MYTYEINVARNGSHESLIKLGVVNEDQAKVAARAYGDALTRAGENELALTLYRVPIKTRQKVEF